MGFIVENSRSNSGNNPMIGREFETLLSIVESGEAERFFSLL